MKFMPRKREDFFPKLFQSDLDSDFFDRFFKESNYPQVDVKEANGQYEVVVDVPGFSKDDIHVDFKDGYLSISGKKEESSETSQDEGHYIRKERSFGSFKRSFYVGDVDEQAIKGNFKDGVLQLTVPKPEEKDSGNGKRIEIE
ncbi:Hsp20/alpha crystallin family protein [Planococcus sp. A6]|uniref:Hsp20/alpha crystallin family protein n=1 Tax=Planococcus sp. A6 TaxID=2992760 RepID=UPI00237BF360|nr:Hsp20/alpha crystallin family protein [Planococcus sp. A6]MDE0582137.1 Hsp20/alpha crystallin family protein [Planococcus sp. A6]